MVSHEDIYSACSDPSGVSSRLPSLSGCIWTVRETLGPTYSEPLAYWLQAHQKATKAKVISGHLSAGRITSGKGLVQEGGGKHLLGLPVKEKQVTLHSEGTQHLACSQTLILEACLEMFREAGKKQAGWI